MLLGYVQFLLRGFFVCFFIYVKFVFGVKVWRGVGFEYFILQDDFDNDVDVLLEEGFCVFKKRRMEEKYGGDSDYLFDGEISVQLMMIKIKIVFKSE